MDKGKGKDKDIGHGHWTRTWTWKSTMDKDIRQGYGLACRNSSFVITELAEPFPFDGPMGVQGE